MSDVATVMVEDALVKEGATNGRVWKKVGLKDANGEYYSTFDAALGQRVIEAVGKRAKIEWKPSKDPAFKDLLSLSLVEESAIATRAPDGTADWDLIGLRKTRCLLWANFLQSPLAAQEAALAPPTESKAMNLYLLGSSLVTLAERDIYHREPAAADEDIPF